VARQGVRSRRLRRELLQRTNRALDEFEFSVVVRTTDPFVTRKRLKVVDGKPTLGSSEEMKPDRLFRTGLNRIIGLSGSRPRHCPGGDDCSRPHPDDEAGLESGRLFAGRSAVLPAARAASEEEHRHHRLDRSDSFRRDESQTNVDALSNYFGRERDISEIANSAIHESLRGSSSSAAGRPAPAEVFLSLPCFGSASGGHLAAGPIRARTRPRHWRRVS